MRYIWKGNISFGLINVPVGLVTAARDRKFSFTLLHKKDNSAIRYARICKEEEKEVPYNEIVKGIQRGGQYKVLTAQDFKAAEGEKSKTIDIATFCDEFEVDSLYYEKPYYLVPEKGGEKAYLLLFRALSETGKVAIVQYVFKNHRQLAAIRPYENLLVLNQMRYHSQIIATKDLDINKNIKVSAKEIDMAKQLIEQLSGPFDAEAYHDQYVENLEKTIRKKTKIAKIKGEDKEQPSAKIYDIMSLLKESLEEKNKPKQSKPKAQKKRASK